MTSSSLAASSIGRRKQEIEMLKCLIMFTLLKCFYWTLFYLHSFPGKSRCLHGRQASRPSMWKRDSCSVLLSLGSHCPDPRTQHPPACLLKHFSVHCSYSSIFKSDRISALASTLVEVLHLHVCVGSSILLEFFFHISTFLVKLRLFLFSFPNGGPPVRGT